jgi:hypothetical protein
MDEEDRRRRVGRAAVKKRIAELEAMAQPQLEPKAEIPPRKVTILPRSVRFAEPLVIPQDEGICKMERALQGCPPPPQTSILKRGTRSESASDTSKQAKPPRIAAISAAAFRKICQRKNGRHMAVVGITSLHEIDRILELKIVLEDDDDQLRR